MKRKHHFIPAPIRYLEGRVVPSHVVPGAPVGHAEVSSPSGNPSRQQQGVVAEVNQDFDLFQNDYDQARSTYFTSIQDQPNPSAATTDAFVGYTIQRVSLLAQQTLNAIFQVKHSPSQSRVLKQQVALKLIGPRSQLFPGSLAGSLLQTLPQPGTTAPTSSLYTLGQNSAIASAQTAIVNSVENR